MKLSKAKFIVKAGGQIRGKLRVPGDKSISHRAVMFGALASGDTKVTGLLEGEDVLATVSAFRAMGVQINGPKNGYLEIKGVGLNGLSAPNQALDMGNSGTAMRLLSGIMAGQNFNSTLTGDESLNKRPMSRVAEPLATMGAMINTEDKGRPPMVITGSQQLTGINYTLPVASAQVKSALLLAGLYAEGKTSITEPAPTRDHTERMLRGFGYGVDSDYPKISLTGGGKLTACDIDVPADISSAAFFIVAATIAKDSEIVLEHVGINPTRIGILNILILMGADIQIQNKREVGGEPVADIHVRSAKLKGIEIPEDQVPLAIDEFPVIFIAAACAEGLTTLSGAEELRVKESDRIAAMAVGLKILGVDVQEKTDGIIIRGGPYGGGKVDSVSDHRIAMAFAIAGLRASGQIEIDNCANVATSFPNFVTLARNCGLTIESVS